MFRAVSTSCMLLRLYAVIKTAFLKHFTKSHPLQASEESVNNSCLSNWQLSHQKFGTRLQFQKTAVLSFMTACNFNFWNRITWNPCSVNMNLLSGVSIYMLRSVGVVSFTLRLYKCQLVTTQSFPLNPLDEWTNCCPSITTRKTQLQLLSHCYAHLRVEVECWCPHQWLTQCNAQGMLSSSKPMRKAWKLGMLNGTI